jgi:hypothetical protein
MGLSSAAPPMKTRLRLGLEAAGRITCATAILLSVQGPVEAQGAKGYVEGTVAMSTTAIATDGTVSAQVGIRIVPRLLAFVDVGRIPVTLGALRSTADAAEAAQPSDGGGAAFVLASCVLGGLRVELSEHNGWTPYVLSAVGVVRASSSDGSTSVSDSPIYRFGGGLEMSLVKSLSADIGYAVTYKPFAGSPTSQGITVSLLLRF